MAELCGKGWRVIGYFVWMLGAGVLLDGDTPWMGGLLLVAGAGLFLLGVWQSMSGAGGVRE
jgi:hypothetical protein